MSLAKKQNGLRRVISGAQTGVDRAALDAVIESGSHCSWGGCVPKGRLAEDGEIPDFYFNPGIFGCGLIEHKQSRDYKPRTVRNVADADATLILRFQGGGRTLSPGTKLTLSTIQSLEKSYRIYDPSKSHHAPLAVQWICETIIDDSGRYIEILNVAGPRESGSPGIYEKSKKFMIEVLNYTFCYRRWGLKIWSRNQI